MTSISCTGPRCVQELATILAPQNRIQGRCVFKSYTLTILHPSNPTLPVLHLPILHSQTQIVGQIFYFISLLSSRKYCLQLQYGRWRWRGAGESSMVAVHDIIQGKLYSDQIIISSQSKFFKSIITKNYLCPLLTFINWSLANSVSSMKIQLNWPPDELHEVKDS